MGFRGAGVFAFAMHPLCRVPNKNALIAVRFLRSIEGKTRVGHFDKMNDPYPRLGHGYWLRSARVDDLLGAGQEQSTQIATS
jgi:hypothetical protein